MRAQVTSPIRLPQGVETPQVETPQTVSAALAAQSTESPGGGDAQKTRTWPTPNPFSPREAVPSRHSG